MAKLWACDLTKWLIIGPNHTSDGRWRACPPLDDADGNRIAPPLMPRSFDTGAEALAAFAAASRA